MPGVPKLVGVAPSDGSPKTNVKPSAGVELGLLSVMVKLSWMSPVEIRSGHTISPNWSFVAVVNWKLHSAEPGVVSSNGDQFVSQRFPGTDKGPTKRPAETLTTDVVLPLLTTT